MRLWTIHPKFLDVPGLLALWREGLLAQAVLEGKTVGYRHHPQLERFKSQTDPLLAIRAYLSVVIGEADRRGYSFDRTKVTRPGSLVPRIKVTEGQLEHEANWLLSKLAERGKTSPLSKAKHEEFAREFCFFGCSRLESPAFDVVEGGVEPWEKV